MAVFANSSLPVIGNPADQSGLDVIPVYVNRQVCDYRGVETPAGKSKRLPDAGRCILRPLGRSFCSDRGFQPLVHGGVGIRRPSVHSATPFE